MDDVNNIQINLYRLDDVVKNEIQKALNFYSKYDLTRDLILIERANTCLDNIYKTVSIDNSNEPVVGTLPDALYKENVKNTLNAFEDFLTKRAEKDPSEEMAAKTKWICAAFVKMVKEALEVK